MNLRVPWALSLYRGAVQTTNTSQIERFIRTIKSKLTRYLGIDNRRYVDVLDDIVFQYNKTKHKATRLLPFVLFNGYDLSDTTWQYQDNFFDIQRVGANYARYVLA
ncbi:hypothetical protein CDIK_2836 [Cucumispora dikerogammari]|nr:hypothetical protein CDIK_2836 [Cucumispora dikerogammari]